MEEDIKVLEELCNSFKYQQSKLDELERDDYSEFIQDIEICAIENLIKGYKELEEKNKILKNKQTKVIADSFNEKVLDKFNKDYISKSKIRELPRTEYCNAECLMNGIYVDWEYIEELLEE